ncbi:MAG: CAP domain-containing protein [Chloroflexota bacterium]
MHRLIILFSLSLLLCLPATTPQPVLAQGNEVAWLLAQINALRQRKGIAPLALNTQLAAAANGHSQYLSTHVWGDPHVELNGSTPHSRMVAAGYPGTWTSENVAGGPTATAEWVFNWWLNSPIHLQNMLHNWQEIGIGIAEGSTGRFYTLDFGSQDGSGSVNSVTAPTPPALPATAIPAVSGAAAQPAVQAQIAPPTRKPTRVPTLTPSITHTPTITYTPRATFTATFTPTGLPPTSTAIVLEVSPQAVIKPNAIALAVTAAPDNNSSSGDALVSSSAIPPPPRSGDPIRSLLPIAILLQVCVVGGVAIRSIIHRRRRN